MLSDVGSETIRRFGLLNPVPEWAFGPNREDPAVQADVATYVSIVNPSEAMIGIAFPGTFMLDPDGRVSSRYFEDFYIERNTVSSIIMRLGNGSEPVAATALSTAQLELTTYPSEASIAPGNRFALNLHIEPRDGMHVYAPGADDYRIVGLTIEPQAFVRSLPLEYPESETYYFEPFDEYVPVYVQAFDLVQQIVLEGDLEAQAAFRGQQALTINGRFEYQACSETICYPPQSIPLSWTIPFRQLVFQRPQRR